MKVPHKLIPAICLLLCGGSMRAATPNQAQIADTLMKQIVTITTQALHRMDPNQPGYIPSNSEHMEDTLYCYSLAFLYKTPSPLNPYYGKRSASDMAIAIADRIAATNERPEWPLYWLVQTYALLKPQVPPEKVKAWKAYAADYVATRGHRPFGYTSPNHEIWNAMAIYRAGQVFGEPSWMTIGSTLMHNLVKTQTPLGFFDESHAGQGPSMRYNNIQLAAMLLYENFSGDRQVLADAKKLFGFMARYSYPDGSPIAAFDGRQDYSFGYFGTVPYGFARWPVGKALDLRIYENRKKWGTLDVGNPHYSVSNFYAIFGAEQLVDEYRSWVKNADVPAAASLPQDLNGYRAVDRECTFNGGVVRQHGWMVALSAINPGLSQYFHSPYESERQSRIGIWNRRTGLIVGGGSNMEGAKMPLANFELLTGYRAISGDFGVLSGGNQDDRRAAYFPRALKVSFTPEWQKLDASFGQGNFQIALHPESDSRLELDYRYSTLMAKQAYIQLPVIVFYNSTVQVDGKTYDGKKAMTVTRNVTIANPTTGTTVTIEVPRGASARLNRAVYPERWYADEHQQERYTPFFQIALLSLRLDSSHGGGHGSFLIEVK